MPRIGPTLAGTLGLWLALAAAPAAAATAEAVLRYGGYYAGMRVGEAEITMQLTADGYEIAGKAWSRGIVRLATRWQSEFDAAGRIVDGEPRPERYRYHYSRRGGHERTTRIADGEWERFDAEGLRQSGTVPDGPDMLSALFYRGDCASLDSLHTGRHRYQLELLEHERPGRTSEAEHIERCRFEVEDDEGERYEVELRMAEFHGHRVPLRIDLGGFLSGHVRLLEAPEELFEQRPMASGPAAATPAGPVQDSR